MIRMILHRKLIVNLLIPIYLLIGLGIGNGLLWCQESEAFSHLEYNPAGKCQDVKDNCQPTDKLLEDTGQSVPSPLAWTDAADCLDSPASFSQARGPESADSSTVPLIADLAAADYFPVRNRFVTLLSELNLTAQPPPPQALIALRTVVLLN